jgi:hypothetical protein
MNHFESDTQALELLNHNFKLNAGGIVARKPDYSPTREERWAIDYLCDEWDYCYVEKRKENKP